MLEKINPKVDKTVQDIEREICHEKEMNVLAYNKRPNSHYILYECKECFKLKAVGVRVK